MQSNPEQDRAEMHYDIACSNVLSKFSTKSVLVGKSERGNAGLFAQFGGQGAESYLDELEVMYTNHHGKISKLLNAADQVLKSQLNSPEARYLSFLANQRELRFTNGCFLRNAGIHKQGLNVLGWLSNSHSKPTRDYLIQCAISYPLILLVQLCQYLISAKTLFGEDESSISKMR